MTTATAPAIHFEAEINVQLSKVFNI